MVQVAGDQHNYHAATGNSVRQVLAGLPAAPLRLVGREKQTAELLDLLDPDAMRQAPPVCAVAGLPGVGKTALVLDAAHQAAARGWFPGGVLFAELRGYDPAGPADAGQVLGVLLRALGVPDEAMPPTIEEQAGLYQSELARCAESSGAVLIVADDASSTTQLTLLVPAHRSHRMLITSRDTLADLPARLVNLAQLDQNAAADMFRDAVVRARPDDLRPISEPDALERIAECCAGLPLALRIAGALLVADPGMRLADLADELADECTRLAALRYEDGRGHVLAVRAAFDLSYGRLEPGLARMFALLGVNPGPDVSTDAATALADHPARPQLAALARAGLLSEQPVGSGRWCMHDLIRAYAGELADQETFGEDTDAALDRLLIFYCTTAAAAGTHLRPLRDTPIPDRFRDRANALDWLDVECSNLVAAVAHATVAGRWEIAAGLTAQLPEYLGLRRRLDDWLTCAGHALDAERELGDRHGEATFLNSLGLALRELRRFGESIDAHTRAAHIFKELGGRHGEAEALGNLGSALQELRRFEESIDAHTRAARTLRELGDLHGAAVALGNLGVALWYLRRFESRSKPTPAPLPFTGSSETGTVRLIR